MARAVAYQMQVDAYGGVSACTKHRLGDIAGAASAGTFDAGMIGRRIKPGTKLVRTWHGATHTVTALEDGSLLERRAAQFTVRHCESHHWYQLERLEFLLYKILGNPIYAGKISHKGQVYDGLHEAIIDKATWDLVQAQLASSTRKSGSHAQAKQPSLLAGLLIDGEGSAFSSLTSPGLGQFMGDEPVVLAAR